MSKYSDEAVGLFEQGMNCAQAILVAFGPDLGLRKEQAKLITSGLGGGIGRKQFVCGAINAGAMVLSLKYGNYDTSKPEQKEQFIQLTGDYMDSCQNKLDGIDCSEILKVDLQNPIERQEAAKAGHFKLVCSNAVRQVALILEDILEVKKTF